jgi:hypothetical protein
MNSPVDDLIQQAIEAGKAGDKEGAKRLLSQVVRQDPQNARAWYLLSQTVDTTEQAIYCVEKVLEIDPINELAIKRLRSLKGEAIQPQQENTGKVCPFCKERMQVGAANCPHCGKSQSALPYLAQSFTSLGCLLMILGGAILFCAWFLINSYLRF